MQMSIVLHINALYNEDSLPRLCSKLTKIYITNIDQAL